MTPEQAAQIQPLINCCTACAAWLHPASKSWLCAFWLRVRVVDVCMYRFQKAKLHVSSKTEYLVFSNVYLSFCCISLPHPPSSRCFFFPLSCSSMLTYQLPAENSQEHLEGEVLYLTWLTWKSPQELQRQTLSITLIKLLLAGVLGQAKLCKLLWR